MNAVVYARYSNGPRQTEQSIEGQLRDCKDFAQKHDITIIGTYIDRAISGTDFIHRNEFNRLMADCSKKKFEAVIVWKVDRFGRNREEIALNKIKLKKHGVRLLYAKEHIPDGPEGIILESLLEGMAEYYSAELSQKVKRGLRESALKGYALGGNQMFGYLIKDKKYVADPPAAQIVHEIFTMYSSGYSSVEIAKSLSERHIKNVKGNDFRPNSILQMLRNEKYIGIYHYGELSLDNIIPPIIEKDLWDKVQIKLSMNVRNRSRTRSTANEAFILTGKLTCGCCGGGFCGESGTSRNGMMHYYYKCTNKKHRGSSTAACPQKTFRKDDLETWVASSTVDMLTDDMVMHLVEYVSSIQKSDSSNLYLITLNNQLKDTETSIKNLMKAIEMGIITESTRDRLMELESARANIRTEIAKAELLHDSLSEDEIAFWLDSMKMGDISDADFRERMVTTFIGGITIYENYVLVIYNFCGADGKRTEVEFDIEEIKKTAEQNNVRLSTLKQGRDLSSRTLIYISRYHFVIQYPIFC